jgi:hypothetical protein
MGEGVIELRPARRKTPLKNGIRRIERTGKGVLFQEGYQEEFARSGQIGEYEKVIGNFSLTEFVIVLLEGRDELWTKRLHSSRT